MTHNPYSPPKAGVADISVPVSDSPVPPARRGRKRPVLVWIVLAYYAFIVLAGVPAFLAATTGKVPMPAPMRAYYTSFGLWDYVRVGIPIAVAVAVAVALFRMRRHALYFLLANWCYGVIVWVWRADEMKVLGQGVGQMLFGSVLQGLIAWYLWHLVRKRLLT